jgi:hypothetical protein
MAPGAPALFYGVKGLIAVSADNFLFAGIDRQIQRFKRNGAEQNLPGIGQYEGIAICPAVFPQYCQWTRDRVSTFRPIGEGTRIGPGYPQSEFFTELFIDHQRPRAGIDQCLNGDLPDLVIFDYSGQNNSLINGIFERYFGMYYRHRMSPVTSILL